MSAHPVAPGPISSGGSGAALPSRRTGALLWGGVAAVVALLVATHATDQYGTVSAGAVATGLVIVAGRRTLLAWPTLLGLVILVILFVPIKRYTMTGTLGFQLEPYRVLIAVVVGMWGLALLADPATRGRKTGLEAPIALFGLAALLSIALNINEIEEAGITSEVFKNVTFFTSFVLVMYLAAAAITTRRQLDRILMLLVLGGAVLGGLAVVEAHSGFNLFNHLGQLVPLLQFDPLSIPFTPGRDGRPRSYGSAQHAIALGAALVILLPLGVYLYKRARERGARGRIWLMAIAALVTGALATQSRTGVVMLVAELLVFLWLRRRETVRLLPALVPLLLVVQIVIPGTLGTMKRAFFPTQGSLISSEQGPSEYDGSGRLADVGPALDEWSSRPWFGQGVGTRLPSFRDAKRNDAKIFDDQWLSSLLEVGAIGVLALLWMFVRASRQLSRRARDAVGPDGWLYAGLAASIVAFAVGMITYDAFSFIQVTFLLFMLLGFTAALIGLEEPKGERRPGVLRRRSARRSAAPSNPGARPQTAAVR